MVVAVFDWLNFCYPHCVKPREHIKLKNYSELSTTHRHFYFSHQYFICVQVFAGRDQTGTINQAHMKLLSTSRWQIGLTFPTFQIMLRGVQSAIIHHYVVVRFYHNDAVITVFHLHAWWKIMLVCLINQKAPRQGPKLLRFF